MFGEVLGAFEGLIGREVLTGRKLAGWERFLNFLPFAGKILGAGKTGARAIVGIAQETRASAKAVLRMLKSTEALASEASQLLRIKTIVESGGRLTAEEERTLKAAYNTLKHAEDDLGVAKAAEPHEAAPAHSEPAPATTPGKDLAKENAVHDRANKAKSTLVIDGETHGVAPYGTGDTAAFQFCSEPYCSIVREKVGAVLDALPENYDKATKVDLRRLFIEIKNLEELLKKGKLSESEVNAASHKIAQTLEDYAKRDARIKGLLKKTTEELRAKRAELRGEPPPAERAPRACSGSSCPGTAGTRAGRTYHIHTDTVAEKAAFDRSQRGSQVYEYRDKNGELLYVE